MVPSKQFISSRPKPRPTVLSLRSALLVYRPSRLPLQSFDRVGQEHDFPLRNISPPVTWHSAFLLFSLLLLLLHFSILFIFLCINLLLNRTLQYRQQLRPCRTISVCVCECPDGWRAHAEANRFPTYSAEISSTSTTTTTVRFLSRGGATERNGVGQKEIYTVYSQFVIFFDFFLSYYFRNTVSI